MNEIAKIHSLFRKDIGEELFTELVSIYPAGRGGNQGHSFSAELPLDDSRYLTIVAKLEEADIKPLRYGRRSKERGIEYLFWIRREYEPEDLRRFPALQYMPADATLKDSFVNPDGTIYLPVKELRRARWAGLDSGCWRNVVREDIRLSLEEAGLRGLSFLPTVPYRNDPQDDGMMWGDVGQAWWVLDSTITLPPLSSRMDLRDYRGGKVEPGSQEGHFYVRDGYLDIGELRYDASDFKAAPPFDTALTLEGARLRDRFEVVSQRFYEVCQELGLEARWIPVHVD